MKFEQLLQIYWSRGFLYGGKVNTFNVSLRYFFDDKFGLAGSSKKALIKRFEFTVFSRKPNSMFNELPLNQRKIINMYLSQLAGINNDIFDVIRYNMIRLFLIRTFRGRCSFLGKPLRGQRTRSNASSAYTCNRMIRLFIAQVRKINIVQKKVESLNLKFVKKKIRPSSQPKIKMVVVKKKKNLWF